MHDPTAMTYDEKDARARELGREIERLDQEFGDLFWLKFNNKDTPSRIEQAGDLASLELALNRARKEYHALINNEGTPMQSPVGGKIKIDPEIKFDE